MLWFNHNNKHNNNEEKPKDVEIKDVKLTVNFFDEDGTIVAYCPALDISTCGQTTQEAKKNFQEMVGMFFNDIVENNSYEIVLKELGWRPEETSAFGSKISRPRLMPPKTTVESISVGIPAMMV